MIEIFILAVLGLALLAIVLAPVVILLVLLGRTSWAVGIFIRDLYRGIFQGRGRRRGRKETR